MMPYKNFTQLIDSSSRKEDEQAVDGLIEKANVIVLVYDVNNHECKKRLKSHWMPRIVKINERAPVIFVGNKVDLRSRTVDRNEFKNLLNDNYEPFQQV